MAAYVHYSHLESVKLLYYIITKYLDSKNGEKDKNYYGVVNLEFFSDSLNVINLVQHIKNDGKWKNITQAIWTPRSNAKPIHTLARTIEQGLPYVISNTHNSRILEFLERQKLDIGTEHFLWKHLDKQDVYKNTSWLLYYIDERKTSRHQRSLVKAVLELSSFSEATVKDFRITLDQCEIYNGHFEIFGAPTTFLSINAKLGKSREKDLSLIFNMGVGNVSFAIGQYRDLERSIYSGMAVIKKITDNKKHEPCSYSFDKDRPEDIPDFIWEYFKNKSLIIFEVPEAIHSEKDFVELIEVLYLKSKRNKR